MRAELKAEGPIGAVNLFDNAGKISATLRSDPDKAGYLELGDGGGNISVRSGTSKKERVGYVIAGPAGNGPAAVMGATMGRAASSIQGKSK